MSRVWDPDVDEVEPVVRVRTRDVLDLDALDDGRCKASSWRGGQPDKPTYQNVFGPGGYNRCVGGAGHANRLHKDEWGNVFQLEPFRVVRKEEAS
jgi:hypothetical protein